MNNWIVYNDSGEIIAAMSGSEPTVEEVGSLYWLEGEADPNLHYIQDQIIVSRPKFQLTESPHSFPVAESFSVSGIPVSAVLTHPDGVSVFASGDNGELEWRASEPGRYQLVLNLFPYQKKEWQLVVTA